MSRRIVQRTPVPGGVRVTVELPNAYTDGTSRFEDIFVPDAELVGRTTAERLAAVRERLDDALEDMQGADLGAPVTRTRPVIERDMERAYNVWQRWKVIRAEAVARSMAVGVVTALTARENAAWASIVDRLTEWRAAT